MQDWIAADYAAIDWRETADDNEKTNHCGHQRRSGIVYGVRMLEALRAADLKRTS